MKKVFIVTSGDDLDYTIDGVFKTKEAARKFIEDYALKHEWVTEDSFKIEIWSVEE